LTHRISTGIPEVQTSHQWRLAISKRLRVLQLPHTKMAVSVFFRVLTPSESDCEAFLRATCDCFMEIQMIERIEALIRARSFLAFTRYFTRVFVFA
jgi:hypothetical protein